MTISSIIFSVVAANIGAGKPRQRIIEDLKNCNLVFTNAQDVPVVEFESSELNDRIIIDYVVRNAGGINILSVGTLVVPVDEIQDGGKLFAYRLFGIKKAKIGEEPESVQLTKSTEKIKSKFFVIILSTNCYSIFSCKSKMVSSALVMLFLALSRKSIRFSLAARKYSSAPFSLSSV